MAHKTTKSRRGQRCPVLNLAQEYERLAVAHERFDHPTPPTYRNVYAMTQIDDRWHAIVQAASYLVATSPQGAIFQLMLAAHLGEIIALEATPTPASERSERCVRRLLYRVKLHFQHTGAMPLAMTESYLMPYWNDDTPAGIACPASPAGIGMPRLSGDHGIQI